MNRLLFCLILSIASVTVSAADIAVTVYNNDIGVVSETRRMELTKGEGRLTFTDVPSGIDPNSVRFSLTGKGNIEILEQNYAYDLVSPDQLLRKYIDKSVEVIDEAGKLYAGTLMAFDGATITLRESSGKVRVVRTEQVVDYSFPELPEGLITRPTLFWLYRSGVSGAQNCQVSYQTSGMGWSAEYVAVLNEKETSLDLSGWAAISNNSGKSYTDATLKLVAGSINIAAPAPRYKHAMHESVGLMSAMDGARFENKEFFEYHLYTLPRTATLSDRETKQISLFEPASTSVTKVYLYQPERDATGVKVAVKFTNSQSAGLGMPLPEGRVRVFKADSDGALILVGSDNISHTPKDEEVKLQVGSAFDIVAEELLMDQSQVSPRVEEHKYQVSIRNRKKEPITVTYEKTLYGFWEITKSDLPHKKLSANRVQFEIPAKPEDTTRLNYTVRITHR